MFKTNIDDVRSIKLTIVSFINKLRLKEFFTLPLIKHMYFSFKELVYE